MSSGLTRVSKFGQWIQAQYLHIRMAASQVPCEELTTKDRWIRDDAQMNKNEHR